MVLFVHNLVSADPLEIELKAKAVEQDGGARLVNLLSEAHSEAGAHGKDVHCMLLWSPTATGGTAWAGWTTCSAQRHRHQGEAPGRSPGLSPLADDHAFIAAQVGVALGAFTLPVQQCRQRISQPLPIAFVVTGSAPRSNATMTAPASLLRR